MSLVWGASGGGRGAIPAGIWGEIGAGGAPEPQFLQGGQAGGSAIPSRTWGPPGWVWGSRRTWGDHGGVPKDMETPRAGEGHRDPRDSTGRGSLRWARTRSAPFFVSLPPKCPHGIPPSCGEGGAGGGGAERSRASPKEAERDRKALNRGEKIRKEPNEDERSRAETERGPTDPKGAERIRAEPNGAEGD